MLGHETVGAYVYDDEEYEKDGAESIASDAGCYEFELAQFLFDFFWYSAGEIRLVEGLGRSNFSGSSWLSKLNARVRTVQLNHGVQSLKAKTTCRRKIDAGACSSNLIQRLDALCQLTSDRQNSDADPMARDMDHAIDMNKDQESLEISAISTATSVPPAKIFDLKSLKFANKRTCNTALPNIRHSDSPSVSWRVNEWLAKSFPVKSSITSKTEKGKTTKEPALYVRNDDIVDEDFQPSQKHEMDDEIIDDFENSCVDSLHIGISHKLEQSPEAGAQEGMVSIRSLFKGVAQSSSKRDLECNDTKRQKGLPHKNSSRNHEIDFASSPLRSPPTRRKCRSANQAHRSWSPRSPSKFEKLNRDSVEITEFSDVEPDPCHRSGGYAMNDRTFEEEVGCKGSQQTNTWLDKLQESSASAVKSTISSGRGARRVRGELSRQLQRFEERSEAELKLFRSRLDRGGPSALPCSAEQQCPWCAVLLQRQFFGPLVIFSARALSDPGLPAGQQPAICNLVFSCATAKQMADATQEGTVVKIFYPWSVFPSAVGRPPTVLCSERVAVMGNLQPGDDIRGALGSTDVRMLPCDLLQGPPPSPAATAAICDFPPIARPAELAVGESMIAGPAPLISISIIDSWVSRVSIRARLIKACPRGLLLRAGGPGTAVALPRWMRPLEEAAAASPSSFWCADASGVACEVHVPAELEASWTNLLLGPDGCVVLVTDLTVLGRARFPCKGELPAVCALRMLGYVLQVSPQSTFELVGGTDRDDDAPRPRQRPTPLRRLLEGDGAAECLAGLRYGSTERVTVLVRVARVAPPDPAATAGASAGGGILALEMCVWDPSLARAAVQTVLLRVTEPAQCLACAAVLAIGDTVLAKDVCVDWGSGGSGLELSADGLSQVCLCIDGCGDEGDGDAGRRRSACAGAFGFCLPCVAASDLDALLAEPPRGEGDVDDGCWGCWADCAPELKDAGPAGSGAVDALLSFRGAVVCVRHDPAPAAACPACGRCELRRLHPKWSAGGGECLDEEGGEDADDGGDGVSYACAACEGVCRRPPRAAAAIRAGLDSGAEVLLTGALLERVAAAAAACGGGRIGRRAGEGPRALIGRELRGVGVHRRRRPLSAFDGAGGWDAWELRAVAAHVA